MYDPFSSKFDNISLTVRVGYIFITCLVKILITWKIIV